MKQKLFTLFALVAIAAGAMAQTTHEGHEYVDLGLTSGTLWATYNVGASAPEEAGGYFAWGETDTKSTYQQNNYTLGIYNANAANYGMNKYTNSDGRKTLEAIDDVATMQWGGRWRMPTQAEIQELLDECTWTWKNALMGATSGYTVTGPNGSTIFLPAAGYRTIMGSTGASMGYYCSSSVNEANVSQALGLYFSIDGKETKEHDRYNGYPVRAVQPAIKYTLTVTANKGGKTTGTGIYIANRPATITATPDEHYVFTGWSDGNMDNPRTVMVTGDATYTATFALTQHTLTLRSTNGSISGAESGKKYDYGTVLTLTATPYMGFAFTGWRDGNQENPRTITITEDATYIATFAFTRHTLTLAAENGTISGAESGEQYDYYTELTLTATPNEGYAFTGWSDGNQENPRTFTVTQDTTFTATFALTQHTLTLTAENGTISGAESGKKYDYGTQLTLTVTPNEGYAFTGWSDGNQENPRTITITEDATYTATFALTQHTLTLTAENGTITGAESGKQYDYGTTLTLTATPDAGYAFAGWSDGDRMNPRTITVTQDLTFTATFAAFEYVDLGLPSGTLWATFNVGATSPEQYGDYFAWGETEPKEKYDWENEGEYKWGVMDIFDDTNGGMTKYNETDGKTVLDVEDDAASVHWSGAWRMPTKVEQDELRTECTWTWTTDYNNTGIAGYIVSNKAEHTNAIFLPATGYYSGPSIGQQGVEGSYWSSSRSETSSRGASSIDFNSKEYRWASYARYMGFTVRPVQSPVKYTVTVTASEGGTVTGTGEYIANRTATLTATPNEGYAFAGWSDGNTDNPRTITVSQDLTFTATFAAFEYVDLGLPSGTLWATFNVGAISPEQAGDYFAWGETEPKEIYDWKNEGDYKWGVLDESETDYGLTKYNYTDGKTVLDPEDDAAHVNWGGDWRMPTRTEQEELLNECTWEWTDNYSNTGVAGRIVTGTNGNFIFLPAAGYRYASSLNSAGAYGLYNSSSLYGNYSDRAYALYFNSAGVPSWLKNDRCWGQSVRAVQSPVKHTITVTASEGGTVTGSGEYIANRTATLTATPNEGYAFAGWSDGNTDNPRTITVSQDLTFTATFAAFEYVDLGLPSGTLWATFNVGAAAPEQAGDYFAWGETEPKEDYSEEYYKWGMVNLYDETNYGMTKYNGTDGLTSLEAADDAAVVNWGGKWRMPTLAEQNELYEKCNWEWTDNYNNTGVAGAIVTSKQDNTKSIFLPAAGHYGDTYLGEVGANGFYWSSSLAMDYPHNAYLITPHAILYSDGRHYGQSVRAVQSPVKCSVTVTAGEGGTATGGGEYIANRTATLTATPNEGYVFAGWSDGSKHNPRTITVTQDSTFTATFVQPEYVDLGLPSGTLWATFNVGAGSPEQYGDYFAWGETEPKSDYSWSTYKYGSNYVQLTKYCDNSSYGKDGFTDNKTVLDPEDDAATANWGGDWRMPTTAEQKELLNECTWEWTDNYNNTGVAGRIVTGTNGNSIFLPAAGYRHDTSLRIAGSEGYYWSSSLHEYRPDCAVGFYFSSSGQYTYNSNRYSGYTVRPVQSPVKCSVTVTAGEGGTATGSGEFFAGRTATLTATPNEGYVFACWTDESGKLISSQATYTVTVTKDETYTANFAQPAYVDLGLPSGTLWATFNVGATSPEEYGGYFAWGETETKEYYSYQNEGEYKWGTFDWGNDPNGGMTKYNTIDGKTVLEASDDAVMANWGGAWRMPTSAEQTELDTACTWTWTDDYSGTGIRGYIVSSKAEGNTNSIFLPAAGYRSEANLNGVGSYGRYWSSSLHESIPSCAYRLYFHSSEYFDGGGDRGYGQSVRAVQSKKGLPTAVETVSHSVSVEVRKVLEDGVIYILRGDEKYMIDGRKVE